MNLDQLALARHSAEMLADTLRRLHRSTTHLEFLVVYPLIAQAQKLSTDIAAIDLAANAKEERA